MSDETGAPEWLARDTVSVKEKSWTWLGMTWHRVTPDTYRGSDLPGARSFWGTDLRATEKRALAWMKKHYGYNPIEGRKEFPA